MSGLVASAPGTDPTPGIQDYGIEPVAKPPASSPTPITYADAGVDITRANRTKQRIKYLAHKTFTRGVLSEIGGFGGLFAVDKTKYLDPVLVSSVDGVGTKLKVAFEMNLHSTVGADLVNHCVNDIAVQGAAPMFFMDYLATGRIDPAIAEQIVEGIADACKHNGCALIGGETAEMPGFYPDGEYDLAGFIVGVVDRDKIITGKDVQIGDVILGLPSNGLHTNGYSLARKLLFEVAQYSPETYVNEIKNKVGNELMRTHKSYWPALKKLLDAQCVAALAHITGGGITENLPRVLPRGTAASIELGSWVIPPIFEHLQQLGKVPQDEMLRTFNMGMGMLLVVPAAKFKKAQTVLDRVGEKAYTIGRIIKGERKVTYS
jgi:phosphoribosylformylglycinamidine cyclo-ligase